MRIKSILVVICVMAVANVASADTFGTGANQFTIDFVNISGDASSANGTNISQWNPDHDRYRIFADPGDYRIGRYEITNDQWDKFTNIYGTPTGSPLSAYDGSAYWTGSNVPTNFLSWYEAAQFVNYLNTSTGHQAAYKFTGTQGTSDYTFVPWAASDLGYDPGNPFRNCNAFYFLPTEDEWVKAAYWNGTSLQTYANASPSDLVSGSPDPAKWNYDLSAGDEPWDVGSGSEELNGTFDMMGNVWEMMESPFENGYYTSFFDGSTRGGQYGDHFDSLSSFHRDNFSPVTEEWSIGFRVASVPEPTTLLLLGLGVLVLRGKP